MTLCLKFNEFDNYIELTLRYCCIKLYRAIMLVMHILQCDAVTSPL